MIPLKYITQWQANAPWSQPNYIEQDLVISRVLVELFSSEYIAKNVAFRGGTALHKLFLKEPVRYSEDIDLVFLDNKPIGPLFDEVRSRLDSWLGIPRRKQKENMATLTYRFQAEEDSEISLRLKVEINVKEGDSLFALQKQSYSVDSEWFSSSADITTYNFDELIGSKLRALFQRKKGRDLLDLYLVLKEDLIDCDKVVQAFDHYTKLSSTPITRAMFEENLFEKRSSPVFLDDVLPLMHSGFTWNPEEAFDLVLDKLISKLPGASWKGKEALEAESLKGLKSGESST